VWKTIEEQDDKDDEEEGGEGGEGEEPFKLLDKAQIWLCFSFRVECHRICVASAGKPSKRKKGQSDGANWLRLFFFFCSTLFLQRNVCFSGFCLSTSGRFHSLFSGYSLLENVATSGERQEPIRFHSVADSVVDSALGSIVNSIADSIVD
jgi:hypothetical protein